MHAPARGEAADEVHDGARRRARRVGATVAPRRPVEEVGLDELEAVAPLARAPARARRPTARRRASRRRAGARTTAAPRPPVPPVTIAVVSDRAIARTLILHGRDRSARGAHPTFRTVFVRDSHRRPARSIRSCWSASAAAHEEATASQFLRLTLGDRTGGDGRRLGRRRGAERALRRAARPCVRVHGRFGVHPRWGAQITCAALRPARRGGSTTWPTCSTARRARPRAMEADLRELIATVQCPHLRALLDRVFGPSTETWARVPRGAGRQALPPGLPARAARALADRRAGRVARSRRRSAGVDRDVAVTGALLHDIGKLDAYTADPLAIDMTDLGQAAGRDPARLLPRAPR